MTTAAHSKSDEIRKGDDVPGITRPMTYEEYLASPEEMARYDIIDGWKVYRLYGEKQLANPTVEHQEVQGNLFVPFRAYARSAAIGKALMAPCDVLIQHNPTRTRQSDLLFISNKRFGDRSRTNPAPLDPAPELVVEIVSPSDRPSVLPDKIADYRGVDVREIWVVRSGARTVEVIRLTLDETKSVAMYGQGQTVVSVTFPDLSVPVDDIFAE